MKLTLYMGGVSTPPVYRGSRWRARSPQSPPYVGWGEVYGVPLELALVSPILAAILLTNVNLAVLVAMLNKPVCNNKN